MDEEPGPRLSDASPTPPDAIATPADASATPPDASPSPPDPAATVPEVGPTPPDPSSPVAAVAPLPPGFELPTARQVVGRGLQLALDANLDIRNVSLYVGLLVLVVAGPAAVLAVVDLPRLSTLQSELFGGATSEQAASLPSLLVPLYLAGALATVALVTVFVDGQLMAASILAGRAVARPLTLRESLRRARQVFWRFGFASFAIGILSTVVSLLVQLALGAVGHRESVGASIIGTLIASLALAPFGYILTAIVIGDVDGATAVGRSITLARARPRLALVVAAFAFLASTFQVLGLGAALDIVNRIVTFVDPSIARDAGLVVAIPATAIALVALGSLALTVAAVTAAPQVAAFLGLTHFSAGLDRARTTGPSAVPPGAPEVPAAAVETPAPPAPRPARWVTIPMVALVVIECLIAGIGLASQPAAASSGSRSDPLVLAVQQLVGPTHTVSLLGHPARTEQPESPVPVSPTFPLIRGGEFALLDGANAAVLLDSVWCGYPDTLCGQDGPGDGAFADGAVVYAQEMAVRPDVRTTGEWAELGPYFRLAGFEPAPSRVDRFAGATDAFLAFFTSEQQYVHYVSWAGSSFREYRTYARARWVGDVLLMIIPMRDELRTPALEWGAYATWTTLPPYRVQTDAMPNGASGRLLPFWTPPQLELGASPSATP